MGAKALEDVPRGGRKLWNEQNIDMICQRVVQRIDIGGKIGSDSDLILNKTGTIGRRRNLYLRKTHSVKGCGRFPKGPGPDESDQEYLQYAYNICRYHHERVLLP